MKRRAESSAVPDDEAVALLRLATQLHAARGSPQAWREALDACRDWFCCEGPLAVPAATRISLPDDLEALAGRLTHCAVEGVGACGQGDGEDPRQRRCAALAPHLNEAAMAARLALQADLFEHLPPIWIVDRDGRVRTANGAARAEIERGSCLLVVDGVLQARLPDAAAQLRGLLATLAADTRLALPDPGGGESVLLLRPLADASGASVSLIPEPPAARDLAPRLAGHFGLTLRQGELAALLLEGQNLSDAARQMGISRHTANEHLSALLRRVGVADRKALIGLLRRAMQV